MKYLETYKRLDLADDDAVFDNLIKTIKPSNTLWTYFVNWEKVFRNTSAIEVELNILNYLIGKDDFDIVNGDSSGTEEIIKFIVKELRNNG